MTPNPLKTSCGIQGLKGLLSLVLNNKWWTMKIWEEFMCKMSMPHHPKTFETPIIGKKKTILQRDYLIPNLHIAIEFEFYSSVLEHLWIRLRAIT